MINNLFNTLAAYKFFLKYILLLIFIFFVTRFYLVFTNNINLDFLFFVYALRMDIIVISFFLLLPIILFTFNFIYLTRILLSSILILVIYLEFANLLFYDEFSVRLNYLFIEYLNYPEIVFKMLVKSYKLELFLLIPSLFLMYYYFFNFTKKKLKKTSILYKVFLFPFIFVILLIGLRSSLDSSTPNQSFYSYSNSSIKNDIANNSIFSLAYAVYLKSKVNMPSFGNKNTELIKNLQKHNNKNYVNNKSLLHIQKSSHVKKKNIILLAMESFGSTYVGSLGGTPTTPNFDAMSKDGLFLSNMYSSSNRSHRGFEAILSSIFPIYANSYLKLAKSQNNFWTLARTLKINGYKTVFLYGGDSKFDNMKGFVLNNGFDKVIDKYDFDSNIKRYTWGVSDEELYKKANEILKNETEPIFLLMFTLSSHKPFDYPLERIQYYKGAKIKSFANSIKYADFALGRFYQNLKKNDFFKDGLLTIVADHNAHMSGKAKIPVNEYKIPALFISNDIKNREINTISHQIDIAPTLLDYAGVSAITPTMGTNLSENNLSSALILDRGAYTYLKGNKFILYQQNKKPETYDFNYKKIQYDNNLTNEGLDYIYGSFEIYNKKLH